MTWLYYRVSYLVSMLKFMLRKPFKTDYVIITCLKLKIKIKSINNPLFSRHLALSWELSGGSLYIVTVINQSTRS